MLQIVINNSIGGGTGLPGSGGGGGFPNTYSLDFDGVDDYVSTSVQNATLSTQTWSASVWVNWSALSGNNEAILSTRQNGIGTSKGIDLYMTGNNVLRARVYVGNGGYADITTTIPAIDTWYHAVITFASNTLKLYFDGVLIGSSVSVYTPSTNPLFIGKWGNGNNFHSGLIDEIGIFDIELTQENVTDIYNSGTPTDLSLLATPPINWYRMGDNGSWKSPQFLLPSNENKDKVSNYSFGFDGVDDRVQLYSDFVASGEFTLSFWMKPVSVFGNGNIFPIGTFPDNQNHVRLAQIGVIYLKVQGVLCLFNEGVVGGGANNLVLNEWQHIAFIRDSSNVIRCYRNGAPFGQTATNSGTLTLNSFGRIIATTFGFQGGLDEIAFWNSDETANLSSIYNGGEPTTISGAVLHYKMGEEANFTSNWLVDNSALTNYSKWCFAFDGVDDYIELGSLSNLQNATEYSISSWFKSPLNKIQNVIYSWSDGADGYLQLLLIDDGSFVVYNYRTSSAYGLSATGVVSADTWYNALVVFDGSGATNADRLKLYINGSLITLTYTGTIPTQTGTMLINGLHAGAYVTNSGAMNWALEGNIDELSIFDSASSIGDVWAGSGEPIDVSTVSGIVNNYRMGEDASFNGTNWIVPDNVGSNNGTSDGMMVDALVGEAPNYSGGGISSGMTIEDRVGTAPSSSNNALSFNMDFADRAAGAPN